MSKLFVMSKDQLESSWTARPHPIPLGMTTAYENSKVIVRNLQKDGVAAQVGFQVGDQVLAVNGLALTEPDDVHKIQEIWNSTQPGERVRFSVNREGKLDEFYL
jgi:predicted metalloprotease with PDZ domain